MRAIRSAAVALGATLIMTIALAHSAIAASKTTHLLAMAACPTWKVIDGDDKTTKLMADSCKVDVDTIVAALRKSLAVSDANITTRLNAEADGPGVTKALTELAGRAKPEDRVVIYLNFHGGNFDAKYGSDAVYDEILAVYTAEEPKDFAEATANGDWLTMKRLRDFIDDIKAEEVVVIFEVCEVGGGFKDFRYDMSRRYRNGWKGREAIIFSSRGDQAAVYNEAGTTALFTEMLSRDLTKTKNGNMRDIIQLSAMATHRSRRATCMKDENLDTLFADRATYLDACTQMPMTFDPYGLLDDIQFGGATTTSRWHEIKDHKPAARTADESKDGAKSEATGKDASKPAAKADQPAAKPEPAAKGKSPVEDPFAWTKGIMGQQSQSYGQPVGYPN
jgi:hypothetical protein